MPSKNSILTVAAIVVLVAIVAGVYFLTTQGTNYSNKLFKGTVITTVNTTTTINSTTPNLTVVSSYLNASSNTTTGMNSTSQQQKSYVFSALIGSVLNQGVVLNSSQSTKALQGSGAYAFSHSYAITPMPSPYTNAGAPPLVTSVVSSVNGGGVSFSSFSQGNYDNIMRISHSQYQNLLQNWGNNSESTYLWITGFPVFDQGLAGSLVNQFMLMDSGGAYQAVFGNPVHEMINGTTKINVPISLFNHNWTIVSETAPSGNVNSSSTVAGGSANIGEALTQITTVYVGKNVSFGKWTVQLTDLGQPSPSGISPASLEIFRNGTLTNTTNVYPGNVVKFNSDGKLLYVNVVQTYAGLYAYQKWAKVQLYSNYIALKNGKQFNPGWYVNLLWTTTNTLAGAPSALQSIIIYNSTPANLAPGASLNFVQNPKYVKLTFLGEGSQQGNSSDSIQVHTSSASLERYQNLGQAASGGLVKNITEPAQLLTVSSQVPYAFSSGNFLGNSILYDLTPYEINQGGWVPQFGVPTKSYVQLAYSGVNASLASKWINPNNPLLITVTGYSSKNSTSPITQSLVFYNSTAETLPSIIYNVTAIQLNRALPGSLVVSVRSNTSNSVVRSLLLANLTNLATPAFVYGRGNQSYLSISTAIYNITYNQRDGLPGTQFVLSVAKGNTGVGISQYFNYTMYENPVPNSTSIDGYSIGIDNSSAGVGANPLFQINYSNGESRNHGARNNATYITNTQGQTPAISFNVQPGYTTEKGSAFSLMTPTSVVFNFTKSVGVLRLEISPVAKSTNVTTTITTTVTSTSASSTTIHSNSTVTTTIKNTTSESTTIHNTTVTTLTTSLNTTTLSTSTIRRNTTNSTVRQTTTIAATSQSSGVFGSIIQFFKSLFGIK